MLELFHEEGHKLSSTVGGFLVIRSCTPDAHQYIDHHATLTWDTTKLPPGITAAQEHDRASGATMLTYNCLTPRGFDGAVVGFYLPQPRLGFVFAPIVQEDAVIIRDADSELVAAEVDRHLRL